MKIYGDFYGPEEAPEAKELGQKSPEPTTRLEGAPYPPDASFVLVVDSWIPPPPPGHETDAKKSYKYINPRKET